MCTSGLAVLVVSVLFASSIAVLALLDVDSGTRRHWSSLAQLAAAHACALSCLPTAVVFLLADALRGVCTLFALGVIAWALGQTHFSGYSLVSAGSEALASISPSCRLRRGRLPRIAACFDFTRGGVFAAVGWRGGVGRRVPDFRGAGARQGGVQGGGRNLRPRRDSWSRGLPGSAL